MGLFSRSGTSTKKKGAPQKTSPATAHRIRNILGIQRLESMPAQAARAFQLASDPKSGPADFVRIIESDEGLSARIIRVANSVYFSRGAPANDIEMAVTNIGLDELRCLMSATLLKSVLRGRQKSREQAWVNAVATAICCRSLARFTSVSEGSGFLCGLLHDVGKLIMIQRAGDLYQRVVNTVGSQERSFLEVEEEIFETNHVEVGKWVAETWSFPSAVIQAIAGHHKAWPTDAKLRGKSTSEAMLVKAADTISHASAFGHTSALRSFQQRAKEELPAVFNQFQISTEEGQDVIQKFERQFNAEYNLYELDKT